MLYVLPVYGKKNLYHRAYQKRGCHRADADGSAQQPSGGDKKEVAADADGAELEFLQFIREDDGHQVVGSGAGVGSDDQGHADGQDHAAQYHNGQPQSHRGSGGHKPPQKPVEYVDNGAAQKAADKGTGFYVAFCKQEHQQDQYTLDTAVAQAHGNAGGAGDAGCENGKGVGSQAADQKFGGFSG